MGISCFAGLCVGPMDRILVTIVTSCICGFGNVCFVLSLSRMSVQPLFDHPFIGTVSNALGTVTLHFSLYVQALCSC